MITLSEVSKKYGNKRVLDSISLQVDQGQTLVLLGTSGSGKTTLLKAINYLTPPSSGNIFINSEAVNKENATRIRKSVGYVIQQVGLFPHYTNQQNIELTLKLNNCSENKRKERCNALLELVGLTPEDGERYPHQLSGGQQQRVGIARALANDPPLVLMDEPFGALDPITKQNLITELIEKKLFQDKTVVLVTHDVYEAVTLADIVCLLDQGKIQQLGTPKDLLFRPASTFVKDFFDSKRLQLEMRVIRLSEVYPLLPSTSYDDNSIVNVNLELSIWEALEVIERESLSEVSIIDKHSVKKTVTPSELIAGFYKLKNQRITPAAE